jgi:hypothetical protein
MLRNVLSLLLKSLPFPSLSLYFSLFLPPSPMFCGLFLFTNAADIEVSKNVARSRNEGHSCAFKELPAQCTHGDTHRHYQGHERRREHRVYGCQKTKKNFFLKHHT